MSRPGGFSLCLFFEHEQHLAVAVGLKREMCREGWASLVAIGNVVGAGPGLRFFSEPWE